jgi:CheY-like chemotaxis protein
VVTVLVVDDERPVRELLAMLLEEFGYTVLRAAHGRQALELVAGQRPDLVISDVMMPLLSGVELCRRLKSDPQSAGIPVILMSTAGPHVAKDSGADAFISKPFDLATLETLVAHWAARAQERAAGA